MGTLINGEIPRHLKIYSPRGAKSKPPLPPLSLFTNISTFITWRVWIPISFVIVNKKQGQNSKFTHLLSPPLPFPHSSQTVIINRKLQRRWRRIIYFFPLWALSYIHTSLSLSLSHTLAPRERETVGDESWNRLSLSLSLYLSRCVDRGESENLAEFHCSIKTPFRSVFSLNCLWAFKLSRWINICIYFSKFA